MLSTTALMASSPWMFRKSASSWNSMPALPTHSQPTTLFEGRRPWHIHTITHFPASKSGAGSSRIINRIRDWFDESKQITADCRHRALRHHAEGIFMAETIFGSTITLSTGRVIPVRWIGEQHVREDLGLPRPLRTG
jgi:hypothetical protein